MADFGSGEGGSANTPPFPPIRADEPDPQSSTERDAATEPPSSGPSRGGPGDRSDADDWEPDAGDDLSALPDDEAPLPPRVRARRHVPPLAAVDFRHYAERTVARGCERIADQLDYAADRIALIARNRPGGDVEPLSGPPVPAIGWMQGSARYLRESDLPRMQADLERRVREKPLQTLLLTLSAGWLLGRILR